MKRALFVAVACLLSASLHAQLASDTAFVRFSGDTLRIWHINLTTYCEAKFVSTVEIRSDTLVVIESDTSYPHPRCICYYDISTDVLGLSEGSYAAIIYYANKHSPVGPYDTVQTRWKLPFRISAGGVSMSASYSATDCHATVTPAWTPVLYPLQVGNVWDYVEDLTFDFQTSIERDTVMPNGHRYAVTGWRWDQQYQRQQGDSVFEYSPWDSTEYLLYDFTRSPGDTIFTRVRWQSDTTSMVLLSTGTMELFGKTLRTWAFYRDSRPGIDDEATITVVDSIGPYQFWPSFGPWHRLRGAKIDGRTYGFINAIHNEKMLPAAFALLGNYPNPFNPKTVVSSQLPVASEVKLVVYDMLGREVAVLVNERRAAGHYQDTFDGSGLASGIYYYRLSAGGFVQTKTMILIR